MVETGIEYFKMAPQPNGVNGTMVNGHPSSWQAKHDLAPHFIGGNRLEKAPAGKVKDFVQNSDGHSVITSVSEACQDDLRMMKD